MGREWLVNAKTRGEFRGSGNYRLEYFFETDLKRETANLKCSTNHGLIS